jgi:mannosyltransferase
MSIESRVRPSAAAGRPSDLLERLPWLTWAIPAVVTVATGLWGIDSSSLWRDEAATITMAKRPLGSFFATLGNVDVVHTVYYLLMRPYIAVFGQGTVVVRLPSVAAMVVAAVFTALIARRLHSARAGVFAGVAVATLFPMITRYEQEARSYPLVTALSMIATYLFLRAVERDTARAFAGYGLAMGAAVLVHLFAFPLMLAHGVALWRLRSDRGLLIRWAVTAVVVAVVVTPLAVFSTSESQQVDWITKPGLHTVWNSFTYLGGTSLYVVIPVCALAVYGLLGGPGRARVDMRVLAVAWVVLPQVVLMAVSRVDPVYLFRYTLYCIPGVAVLLAVGLARLRLRYCLPIGLALVLAAVPGQANARKNTIKSDDLRALARIISAHERPGDAYAFRRNAYSRVVAAYPGPYSRLDNVTLGEPADKVDQLQGSDTDKATLLRRLEGVPRVWYIDTSLAPGATPGPLDGTKQQIFIKSGMFHKVRKWKFHGGTVYLLQRS